MSISEFAANYVEQIAQLTKERDELAAKCEKLCEDLSGCVSDQVDSNGLSWMRCSPDLPKYVQSLEAACAELNSWATLLAEDVEGGSRDSLEWWRLRDHQPAVPYGTGWLSPEKKKVLVKSLSECLYCLADHINTYPNVIERAKQSLEACK